MFNKDDQENRNQTQSTDRAPSSPPSSRQSAPSHSTRTVNQILKGSRLTGDVHIDCDLELSGEVEGNITSDTGSNVVIKGLCKGGITTKEGSVQIDGELKGGDIIAGSDVTITGKFGGGKVSAKGKIHIDGEFNGVLEANEIELGARAKGAGRLLYRESLSIARGAKVEGEMACVAPEKLVEKSTEKSSQDDSKDVKPPQRSLGDTAKKPQKVVAMQTGNRDKDSSQSGGEKEQTKASQSA